MLNNFKKLIFLLLFIALAISLYKITVSKENFNYPQVSSETNLQEIVLFGKYEQDGNTSNGQEPIKWIVLDKKDDKILLLSYYVLDAKPFNYDECDTDWERCSLRQWLNDDFLYSAFSQGEIEKIETTLVENTCNEKYNTNSGNNTTDKVFLLNIEETEKFFSTNVDRIATATDYLIKNHSITIRGVEQCDWWLRSSGKKNSKAAIVYGYNDNIGYTGMLVSDSHIGVRPAIWISSAENNTSITNQGTV